MVLCVVSNAGDVLTHFFAIGERVNAEVYSNVLETEVILWMNKKAPGKKFVFQQNSAPAHTARKTVDLLERENVNFWGKDLWPSN